MSGNEAVTEDTSTGNDVSKLGEMTSLRVIKELSWPQIG